MTPKALSREIKFRAWDKEDKLWIAGWSIRQMGIQSDDGRIIFMQFTGLHDKNGKEIYEGDIVKSQFDEISQVKFETEKVASCGCCYKEFTGSGFIYRATGDVEVIGNIYESPELLN